MWNSKNVQWKKIIQNHVAFEEDVGGGNVCEYYFETEILSIYM